MNTFRQEFVAHANAAIAAARALAPQRDRDRFDDLWKRAGQDYAPDGSAIMLAERERDFSLYQHIKKGKEGGDLLFGMGALHLERLDDVLSSEGIRHMTVDDFIKEQAAVHP